MRNVAAVLTVALLVPAAYAATVEINKPRIVYLTTHATELACKAPYRRGCTTLDTEFFCNCVQNGAQWSLEPRLVVTPAIYTTATEIIHHELQHVSDVRTSLNEYAAALQLRTFDSNAACETFVTDEKALFAHTLRNIYRVTTVRRDGIAVAERAGDH